MAYGSDITESGEYASIAFPLSNPSSVSTYIPSNFAYDIAINTLPFFLETSDDTPYRRVTAAYRKQQIDQTREPGEQTLTGWWLRSQSSFHLGAGITYFEPAQDESLRFQYTSSKGMDVWTKGQATLLNDTVKALTTSNTSILIGANDGTNDCLVVADGNALKKITMSNDTPTVSTYTQAGTASTIYDLTTDGTHYWFINGTHVHRGNIGGTTSDNEIYTASSTTSAHIRYVKQRLIAATNNELHELDPAHTGGGAMPAAFYTHPQTTWKWSAIAEGPAAIYVAGYSRTSSSIYKITLDLTNANSLGFPTLNVPSVVVDLPTGEIIQAFDVYLGSYAVICTNKGVRIGLVDGNGDITYGPLLFDADVRGVTFRDKFAYVSTIIDSEAGLIRIDLSTTYLGNTLIFPYAWDVVATGTTATATSVAFLGNSDRVCFAGSGNGVWVESSLSLVPTGYLQTGYIRYNTLEHKIFKFLTVRSTTAGAVAISSVAADGTEYNIGAFAQNSSIDEIGIPYPIGPQQYIGFKFTFSRSDSDSSVGPLFTGYQVKTLPGIPRQHLIQYPVMCYDRESDKYGNMVGYDGAAWDKFSQLENLENIGDTVKVQDFRTGEVYIGLIEEIDFTNKTPTDKRFSGYGGVCIVTVRTT